MFRQITSAVIMFALFGAVAAWAGDCAEESVDLYKNQDLRLRLVFRDAPAVATAVSLYSADKLIRTHVTGKDGWVNLGALSPGGYRIVVTQWGTLKLTVHPELGANGPWITWSRKPGLKSAAGKNTAAQACLLMMQAD